MANNYVANYQDGDTAFWGNLIESGPEMRPSALFSRLTDSLFFFLDANVSPQRTGYLEPSKVAYWNDSWLKPPTPVRPEDADAYNRIHCEVWNIPIHIVTAPLNHPQGGEQISAFDRSSFMMTLFTAAQGDPDEMYTALRTSVSLFRLADPLTNQPFPPLPRSALPSVADPVARQRDAAIGERFKQRTERTHAAIQSYSELVMKNTENIQFW